MQIKYIVGDRELLNQVIVRFYLADKAVGAKGFKAIWTEINRGTDRHPCIIVANNQKKKIFDEICNRKEFALFTRLCMLDTGPSIGIMP